MSLQIRRGDHMGKSISVPDHQITQAVTAGLASSKNANEFHFYFVHD